MNDAFTTVLKSKTKTKRNIVIRCEPSCIGERIKPDRAQKSTRSTDGLPVTLRWSDRMPSAR